MKAAAVLALLAACIAGAAAMGDPTEPLAGVLDLDPDTFDKHVNGAKDALIEFYAPWCGHCKHLTPEYKKLGAAVAADPKLAGRVVVAKVDADAHRSLGERFGVRGFPTIKHFRRGQPVASPEDYNGGRTADDFLAHIRASLAADKGFARVDALDALARAVVGAGGDAAAAVDSLKAAAGKLAGEAKEHGAIYVHLASKAADKGSDFFAKEAARLERMLASGKVGPGKLVEIGKKLSVLGAFTEDEPAAAAA